MVQVALFLILQGFLFCVPLLLMQSRRFKLFRQATKENICLTRTQVSFTLS